MGATDDPSAVVDPELRYVHYTSDYIGYNDFRRHTCTFYATTNLGSWKIFLF
jgi:hypothetical protein